MHKTRYMASVAVLVFGVILPSHSLFGATKQIGGSGLGFSCDVNTQECTCDGVETGADCQGMKKNCGSNRMVCIDPINYPGQRAHCLCTMGARVRLPGKKAPINETIKSLGQ